MNPDEIRRREQSFAPKKHYQNLEEIAEITPPGEGIKTGWRCIDNLILGLQPNRMNEFVGYTSHGKTAGMVSVVNHNLDHDDGDLLTVYASGDDSPESLLWKFIAMKLGMSMATVMRQTNSWRQEVVREHFAGRLVIATTEGSFSSSSLAVLIEQIRQDNGRDVDLVCYDYLGTLEESREGLAIMQGALAFKRVVRTFPDTVFILGHQCGRRAVQEKGQGLETHQVEYGGVKECDGVMIGFRRRLDTEDLDEDEKANEALRPSVNLSVMKNKVTGDRSPIEGYRMAIDPISGLIREMTRHEVQGNVRSLEEVKFNRSRYKEERSQS